MSAYTVEFDRIGRNHHVPPLTTEAADAQELAERIYRHGRPHLGSRDMQAIVDLETMTGSFLCGFRTGGTFRITGGTS